MKQAEKTSSRELYSARVHEERLDIQAKVSLVVDGLLCYYILNTVYIVCIVV